MARCPPIFTEWDKTPDTRDLLPHEFTHSWNGKFRRPADLWTANFNVPMRNSLLWVYEGQTQYWGYVLAARSGLLTKQQALDAIAATAAAYDNRKGREWRPLADTTNDPIVAMRRPLPWRSWQRAEDYYSEGELIWLDADTLIRQISSSKKSLDDFAKAFFGIDDGSWREATYSFDAVVKTLNAVAPHDWAAGSCISGSTRSARARTAGRRYAWRIPACLQRYAIGFCKGGRSPAQSHGPDLFARIDRRARIQTDGRFVGRAGISGGADRRDNTA